MIPVFQLREPEASILVRAQIGRRPPVDNFLGMSRMVGRQIGPGRQLDNQQINNRVLGCRLHQRERFPSSGTVRMTSVAGCRLAVAASSRPVMDG